MEGSDSKVGGPGMVSPGHPFGFLKAKRDMRSVVLHVLPYNYPMLFDLIGLPPPLFSIL